MTKDQATERSPNTERIVITYGTFDLFHIGHLNLLKRLRNLGTKLIVGVSTDEFNSKKGKSTIIPFADRLEIVKNIKYVDLAIPEITWEQKIEDIKKYDAKIFGIGDDWEGKFDNLKAYCEVKYLKRTDNISSTLIKGSFEPLKKSHILELKAALDTIQSIIEKLE
ncbi:adenylyltransferase/cytidyltransferase family protein [Hydrogenophaga sp. NFH-34]|uniref:adenylyltransferase/cytidyltransferase family protein n=1 Tax=Hydrogenophaga sp. NFH-34 TaxID=2744446 RepID=UPI001F48C642|nr:adenylyltransferase/cytidyltransferase family protein [Hydrogenophaga sp. NFH-34]